MEHISDLQDKDWFVRIMKSEGGFNPNEPASVGGKSYAGISQATYTEWCREHSTFVDAPAEVEELAGTALGTEWEKKSPLDIPTQYGVRVDVIMAFYRDYFKNARLDIVPECLGYIHADFYTNARYTANKVLQKMVGFEGKAVDGILGSASRQKIGEMREKLAMDMSVNSTADDDLILRYHELKLEHYESLQGTEVYTKSIRGWKKRAQHVLAELEDYFHDDEPTTSAIADDEEPVNMFADHETDEFTDVQDSIKATDIEQALDNATLQQLIAAIQRKGA